MQRRIDRHPWLNGDGLRRLPLPPITKTYIRHILGLVALQQQGTLSFPPPYPIRTVVLRAPVDLLVLQKQSGIPVNQIFRFNPQLQLAQYFDTEQMSLSLRIPTTRLESISKRLPGKTAHDLLITLSRSDSLRTISRRYHISVHQLRQANPRLSLLLKCGSRLRIPADIIRRRQSAAQADSDCPGQKRTLTGEQQKSRKMRGNFILQVALLGCASDRNLSRYIIEEDIYMNVDQHLKVAQWHVEQARLHATTQHTCGCPVNEHYQKIIDEVESGKIQEELACSIEK